MAVERADGRTEDGEKGGVRRKRGILGKAEMLKNETLKGRMLRGSLEAGEFTALFNRNECSSPDRFAKICFGGGFLVIGLPACQVYLKTKMRSL